MNTVGLTLRLSGRCLLLTWTFIKLGLGIGSATEGSSAVETPALEKCPAKESEPGVDVVGAAAAFVVPVPDVILLKLLKRDADVFERLSLSGRMRLFDVPVRT